MINNRKIVVIGVSASGKSTFARVLSEKLDISLVHVDELMWNPGWEYIGDEATIKLIEEASGKSEWIIEGYISKAARTNLFEKSDLVLYLDYPGWFSACRYVKRWWQHRKNPRPELPGCPEKFSLKFLKLVFTKGEVWKLEKLFKESDWDDKIIRFKTPKEAGNYLKNL